MCKHRRPVYHQPSTSTSGGGDKRKPPPHICHDAENSEHDFDEDDFDEDEGRKQFLSRRQRLIWLTWLRKLFLKLGGSEAELELYLAVATREITLVQLGKRLGVDRRTAKQWWHEIVSGLRRLWIGQLSSVALQDLRTGRSAVNPWTILAIPHPPAVLALPGCERQFSGVPTVAELGTFCERVYTTLFGRHGAVLALQRDAKGNTTAVVVVVPSGPSVSAHDHDDDRFSLAA